MLLLCWFKKNNVCWWNLFVGSTVPVPFLTDWRRKSPSISDLLPTLQVPLEEPSYRSNDLEPESSEPQLVPLNFDYRIREPAWKLSPNFGGSKTGELEPSIWLYPTATMILQALLQAFDSKLARPEFYSLNPTCIRYIWKYWCQKYQLSKCRCLKTGDPPRP